MLNDRCPNLEKIELHTKVASNAEDAGASNGQRRDDADHAAQAGSSQSRTPSDEQRKFHEELSGSFKFTLDMREYASTSLHCRYIR